MWNVAITYEDPNNFMTDKTLFNAAIQSAVTYLNQFIVGSTTLNVTVSVSATSTGRFAGGGANYAEYTTENGLNILKAEAAAEFAAGANLNGSAADLTIYVDPTSSYFKGLYFDGGAYDAPRSVPNTMTDGLSVVLHELMHGLGINSYRDTATTQYNGIWRTVWDKYVTSANGKLYLDMPNFASHGIDPVEVSSTSVSQNNSHLGDATNLQAGYLDDIMNGLYFYGGHHYEMSQLDVLILQGLGYTVTMPDNLALSDGSLTGKGLVKPVVTGSTVSSAMTSNLLHLSGTAQAGSTTSVLEHNTLLAQAKADASGHWSLDVVIDPSLAASALVVRDGTHVIDSDKMLVSRSADAGLHLYGSAQFKQLVGGTHDDLFTAGPRGASIDGGAGLDKVAYASDTLAANTIARQGDGGYKVSNASGADLLHGVERLQFSDASVALDTGVDGVAGQAYRVYQAAFNRAPDAAGLGYWISVMDHGGSLLDVSKSFVSSKEFQDLYGAQPSNADIVGRYYQNVLHRTPDQAGFDYWVDAMKHGGTAADVLASFSQSAENIAALVGVMQNGVAYTAFG
ncbi:DUF4214 domain-containing protein [Pseudoduganella sp. FT25W]|uniref:DUF4214 domain-containing protein n=1 Tax=Duganella alba TaxID=2666081 RepID=A0A6L5QPE5_9BURK|nr:DUF4214 domain-containing protein [Duganella alba]MRX11535.1 DUF4214 domain-containing protein [Duganella alba]MRX19750.1 DUF4214 domain-containing protein [Duganella alba]